MLVLASACQLASVAEPMRHLAMSQPHSSTVANAVKMPRVQHATRSRVLRLRGGDLSGPFRSKQLWQLYTQLSRQQPMLFNVVTVGALGVAGDALMHWFVY